MVTFLKRSHACTVTLSAPSPAAGHHHPMPPLETLGTHRQVRDSLLWGHFSFSLGSGMQGSVVPSKSLFPGPV